MLNDALAMGASSPIWEMSVETDWQIPLCC